VIMNGGSLSGGSVGSLYVKEGTVQMNGGDIMGSKTGIRQLGGEVIISDLTIESSSNCLFGGGGTTVIGGGKYSVTQNNGFPITVNGGNVQVCGGEIAYNSVGIIVGKGKVFIHGGTVSPNSDANTYGVYAKDTAASDMAEITVNGGTIKAGYAGIFLENVGNGSAVINGGTIESTGVVGVTAKDCPLTITGGKITSAETVCSVNVGKEDIKNSIKGGVFSGVDCLIVIGKSNVSIDGGTYKATGHDLVISSNYEGKLKYDKSLFKNVLDGRKSDENKIETVPTNTYKRFDVEYKKGMFVADFDTLYSLFCVAFEQLIDEIDVYTSEEVFSAVYGNFGDLFRKYSGSWETTKLSANQIKHSDGRIEYVIKFTFGMESQINSVSLNKSVYKKADKEVQKYSDEIDRILDSIIKKKMTNEEKVTAVHDYLCENYSYADPIIDQGPKSDHSFHAMLDDGTGVCQAYSTLFHVMMLKLGIEDYLVVGKGSSNQWGTKWEDHMWNCVVLDGNQLFVDVTWDDAHTNTDYLLKSEEEFYANGLHKQDIFWK
ncbi:MAG: hypothetical protein J5499_02095, partial [Lachnospiraceae bacterium]|nr:hypothetical protein [Lachnospiraceae bacterium]